MVLVIIIVMFIVYLLYQSYVKNKIELTKEFPKKSNQLTNRIVVTYQNSEYDITEFAKRHPGGKSILNENNGKDIEKLMLKAEHSDRAYKILEKYKIS